MTRKTLESANTGGDATLADQIEASPVIQQIGLLNLRINDMMTQLNAVIKAFMDENTAQKKEIADLNKKQQQISKS